MVLLDEEGALMEIFVWKAFETVRDRLGRQAVAPRKFLSNRRTSRQDRRRSNNDGLIVTLSTREEKRHTAERRQNEVAWERFVL